VEEKRLEFAIEEAGCLIWLAPMGVGGVSPERFGRIWSSGSGASVAELVGRGAMMPMSLYQDDGYTVRFVLGELTAPERDEWTARVRWMLDIPCGRILVSGSLSEDFEYDIQEFARARHQGSYELGCYVEVPWGDYLVEVYGYPPGDLSGGWGRTAHAELFGTWPGIEAEDPMSFFRRTRPGETAPVWISGGYDATPYVDFVVRLVPLERTPPVPTLEPNGCIEWEYRKPELCPLGLRSSLADGP